VFQLTKAQKNPASSGAATTSPRASSSHVLAVSRSGSFSRIHLYHIIRAHEHDLCLRLSAFQFFRLIAVQSVFVTMRDFAWFGPRTSGIGITRRSSSPTWRITGRPTLVERNSTGLQSFPENGNREDISPLERRSALFE
jgi:hypothetical protein